MNELFLFLYLVLASGVVGLWTNCCCNQDPCLARCIDFPPDEVTVTIRGLYNSTYCNLCDGYNTTYILGRCSDVGSSVCYYGCPNGGGYFNGPCNGLPPGYIEPPHIYDVLSVNIASGIPGHTTLQVWLSLQNLDLYIWQSGDLGVSPIQCSPLTVDLPLYSVQGMPRKCSSNGQSITVTM